ncbi:MAG TPA: AMP-dependent synthetase/ligase [Casimicrobiaceae bacterium]|nr:AMP-dependent synthetase/ligase [Casimicrobiaceae bacterium]
MAVNLAELFSRHLAQPGAVLYRHATDAGWRDVTVGELAAEMARWQAAFRREGLVAGDRVALAARNGPTWAAIDLAALGLALVVVPLYVEDNPESLAWCIANAEAKLAIVENVRLSAGLRRDVAAGGLPRRIVVLRAEAAVATGDGAVTAAEFLAGAEGPLEIAPVSDDMLATICYTSGTAGRPKGVMLSHGNILANVAACRETGMARASDRFLSILPLSHMFERTGGYYLPLSLGAKVVYARSVARLPDDFLQQSPTAVFAVPRIFDRFAGRIERSLADSRVKRALFDACVERGFAAVRGHASPLEQLVVTMLRAIVAAPILSKLGGRLRLAVIGGAPLDPALARMFIGLGLPVLQGYGLTEASPVVAVNRDDDNDPESVGPPLPGVEVRLGEGGGLEVRAPSVMLGYWRNEEATRAAIDADGWLATGDVAEIRGGRLYIRGRLKDILVLSNGEKLPPQDAELAILRDPVFEQAMLIGESRPYPVLLAVTHETDEKTLVRRANEQLRSFPRWVRVRRVIATKDPWDVESGLLTPTLKLRRPLVARRFAAEIEAAYAEE